MMTLQTITGLIGILAVLAGTARCDTPLALLDSTHNGSGVFVYTLRPANATRVLGGDSNMTLRIPGYSVNVVSSPPGWVARLEPGAVTWRPAGAAVRLVDAPLVFALQSDMATAIWYDQLAPGATYPPGTLAGTVYTTNGTYYQSGGGLPASNALTSVNIAGFERLAFYGPLVPEPALLPLVLLPFWACARRGSRSGFVRQQQQPEMLIAAMWPGAQRPCTSEG